jgi:hypothetical protein
MRLFAAAALLLLVGGVAYVVYDHWPRTERHDYAVGAKDEVVAPYPCRLAKQSGDVVRVEEWAENFGIKPLVFTARAPGTARFQCSGATFVVAVRAPVRVVLRAPAAARVGERFTATLVARDADGGELEIGRYGDIEWTFTDGVAADNPGSCEFPPWCGSAPAASSWARATATGVGKIAARFGGLDAAATITVAP